MRRTALLLWIASFVALGGCGRLLYRLTPAKPPPVPLPNPVTVPPLEAEFVWLQVVDVVDDYFRIQREQPVQNRGEIVMEGRLDTTYQVGATLLEPWRKDSAAGFERLQSTLQSIRRQARVTVRPLPVGYEVEVVVRKELEDVDRPQFASESAATVRHDGTVLRTENGLADQPLTLGWIPQGRDLALEQQLLNDIVGRLTQPDSPGLLHGGLHPQ